MADTVSPDKRSEMMRRVGSKNTAPERAVRRVLFARGYRYRLHRSDLPGKPDLVFSGRRKAIFVHGCFWHQHPGCSKATIPKTRHDWWRAKLTRNVERDKENQAVLEGLEWTVFVAWECEIRKIEALIPRLTTFLDS